MKILMTLFLLCSASAWAAPKSKIDPKKVEGPKTEAVSGEAVKEVSPEGEAVDVSKVTEKYWAQGKDTELGVVQNRKYTSEHRFELDLLTGTDSVDPFLNVQHYGASLGYYFSQYFSLHGTWVKMNSKTSAAYDNLRIQTNGIATVGLNHPKAFYGLEANQNFLYGKASLFGHAIIYVDIFALAGMGIMDTDTGSNFAPFIGLGQKIHINQTLALHLDYRIMRFNETIPTSLTGTPSHQRSNTTDVVTLGLCFFY
ncbi:MAG: outer membrane beta-barrel domain-containing protein [Bdellovibrionales bacterium]|nr:outer membrane beta-barrel domain-containing protein [Oligoflexia bacterium]